MNPLTYCGRRKNFQLAGMLLMFSILLTIKSVSGNFNDTLIDRAKRQTPNVDIDGQYGQISTIDLLQQVRDQQYIVQLIEGFNAVYNKMRENNELNGDAVIRLAQHVRDTLNMPNLGMVHPTIQGQLLMLRDSLPRSIKNAVFERRVCIKNAENNEYLISPSQAYLYDLERRRVFTWIPGTQRGDNFQVWNLEFRGTDVFIRNVATGEYLYAPADIYKYDSDRRRVFTWTQRLIAVGDSGIWKLEGEGDNVNIKSNAYSEYLYAAGDGFNHDNDRRSVYTWGPGEQVSNGLWTIEQCF